MRAAAFLAAAAKLPMGTIADVTGGRGLVVVAPHPDDESLGCGGIIAAARAEGSPVRIVVVSDGVGSHPNSRTYPPPRLRELREAETRAAAAELGVASQAICFLRLPDRAVPPEGPDADAAVEAIVSAAREIQAGAVCVTWAHDPHCDHAASASIAWRACQRLDARLFYYPVWAWTLPEGHEVGPAPRGIRFDASRYVAAKTAAIGAHRSQATNLIDDDPDGFRLVPEMITRFVGPYEIFLEAELSS